ncbi:Zn-dependent oligopeptidase [Candidatus Babeliales bacterium]|nr:Zn-dependent oligopeptidase [Candidatus Babeliales bacterium]
MRQLIYCGLVFGLLVLPGCQFVDKVGDDLSGKSKGLIDMDYIQVKDFSDVVSLFPKSAKDIAEITDKTIEETKRNLEKLISIKAEGRTFDNTARALDIISTNFGNKLSPIHVLEMVSPEAEIREAARKFILKADGFAVDAFNNVDLYKAFKSYVEGNTSKENLNSEEKYFLEEEMKDFIRAGLNLPAADLEEVKGLKKELSKLSLEFETNINEDKTSIKVRCEGLDGLSDEFINQLKRDGDDYILTCDYPTYHEVIQHCKAESTRRDLYLAFNNRAYPQNIEILEKIIGLRDRLAHKLGFKSYADLNIDSQMAKGSSRARQFILDLVDKSQGKAQVEIKEWLKDLPEGITLTEDGKVKPWDIKFLQESYKKKHFDVDERKIAEYFPMQPTINALFDIYQKFFSLRFKINKPSWSYHEDVQLIEIYDNKDNNLIGYIFLDLFPRPNKYSHACHCDFVEAIGSRPSAAIVIANFPKQTKEKPSLLKHDDVVTFFHEFGHAMHAVLGRTELGAFSGTATKTDFVEMPSQMFEEWMWDKEILKSVSNHYKTGKSLPADLINKMVELKKFDSGYFVLRQCVLSLIALNLFDEGERKDSTKIVNDLWSSYVTDVKYDPRSHFHAAFGHLTGYGARYYGYMWSKVFALDIFDAVKKNGLLNPDIGKKLVDLVLGKGGSVEPEKLLKDFLGREPNQNAFLEDMGFLS